MAAVWVGCASSSDGNDDALMPPTTVAPTTVAPTTVGSVATGSNNDEHPPPEDVTLGECIPTGPLGPSATGTLTNPSSDLSNYVIDVNFMDAAGTLIASGTAFVNNVPSGYSAQWRADSLATDYTAVSCQVVRVDRYSTE